MQPYKQYEIFNINDVPAVGTNAENKRNINLGGFSGLHCGKESNEKIELWTITDRGPNGIEKQNPKTHSTERLFFKPDFNPKIVKYAVVS